MESTLLLPPVLRAEIEALVRNGYPNETCGLLLGRSEAGVARVLRQWSARNLNQQRANDRFELDPQAYLAAEAAATAAGMTLVGIWHSHPDHPAIPSPTDREMAWSGWSYLIVAVTAGGIADLRSWRIGGDDFYEEELRHG